MNRYACINADNIVTQIVLWDGVTIWSPPDDQTVILIPDDDLFIEARGTLNPKSLKFTRYQPTEEELDAERAALRAAVPMSEKTVSAISALVAVLVEKGTITPDDVKNVEAAVAGNGGVGGIGYLEARSEP